MRSSGGDSGPRLFELVAGPCGHGAGTCWPPGSALGDDLPPTQPDHVREDWLWDGTVDCEADGAFGEPKPCRRSATASIVVGLKARC